MQSIRLIFTALCLPIADRKNNNYRYNPQNFQELCDKNAKNNQEFRYARGAGQ